MNKVVYGLLMSALFLGACGSNGVDGEYEYDPFGSTAQQQSDETSSSSSYTKPSRNNTPSSSRRTTESSSESSSSENKESNSVTTDQRDTLIVFTQMDSEDRGYKLKFQGSDLWNVSVNEIDNGKRWIVTTEDSTYGRVKAIYEWDGNKDSGATLIYLLISGEELVNNLHS